MTKWTKSKSMQEYYLRTSLFLRYGVEDVDPKKPPSALISWRVVAKIMKLPYQNILGLKRKFFGEDKPEP